MLRYMGGECFVKDFSVGTGEGQALPDNSAFSRGELEASADMVVRVEGEGVFKAPSSEDRGKFSRSGYRERSKAANPMCVRSSSPE